MNLCMHLCTSNVRIGLIGILQQFVAISHPRQPTTCQQQHQVPF